MAARYNHPIARPNGGRVGPPVGVRLISTEITLQQVGSYLCSWLAFRRDCAMPGTLREELLFPHQTSHALTRTRDPLCFELCMHSWASVHASVGLESDLHLRGSVDIFSAVLAERVLGPDRVTAHRHREHPTHGRNRILVPMLRHELLSHGGPREKMPVLRSDMVDKSTSPFPIHFGPVFGDEAVQAGLLFPE
jgi:hypothetical protein